MRLENLKCLKRSNYAYTVVKSFINNCDEVIFWKFAAWLISSTYGVIIQVSRILHGFKKSYFPDNLKTVVFISVSLESLL